MFKSLIIAFAVIAAVFANAVAPEELQRKERAITYSTYGAYPYAYSAGVPAVSAYSAYPAVSAYSAYPAYGAYTGWPSVRYY